MVYFTSDLHLGHEKVLSWRKGFNSVDEMDERLISNWNSRVHRNDFVIITGDLIYKSKRPAEEYLSELKGRKILVKGNHDGYWLKASTESRLSEYFEGIYDLYSINRNGVKLRFCHFPMISWEGARHGSILICGHIHDQKGNFEAEMFGKVPNAFNAGVDINGFVPVTLIELVRNNDDFYGTVLNEEEQAELLEKCRAFAEMC